MASLTGKDRQAAALTSLLQQAAQQLATAGLTAVVALI